MRRLTSAEYAYTIHDLTGVDLQIARGFTGDAVGGEGFTNVGSAQFIQDATLQWYLDTAKTVAAHAVVGSGRLGFFENPGQSGLELSAIRRIQAIYRGNGFRTKAGEGAEPFGLDHYARGFFVAWQFRYREQLGRADVGLAELAADEGISTRFAEHIYDVLNEPTSSLPVSVISAKWRALPPPGNDRAASETDVRRRCDDVYALLRDCQNTLTENAIEGADAPVITVGEVHVAATQPLAVELDVPTDARLVSLRFSVSEVMGVQQPPALAIWKNPRIAFLREDETWTDVQSVAGIISDRSSGNTPFGEHPGRGEIDAADLAMAPAITLSLDVPVPKAVTAVRLLVDAKLDTEHSKADIGAMYARGRQSAVTRPVETRPPTRHC